jgi:predicted Fe-Mo cluster-binding NifX family protein
MKVAVPTNGERGLDEEVGLHFGKVPTYTIVDTQTNQIQIVENTSEHRGGVGLPPELIANTGADVMIVFNAGMRAINRLQELGIDVYTGAQGTVREAIEALQDGRLEPANAQNACKEHEH